MSSNFKPFKYRAVVFTDKPDSFPTLIALMNAFNFAHFEMNDPREFIKRFKNEIPLTCIIDTDVSLVKEAMALIKSLRNLYGSGILIFGIAENMETELAKFAKSSGANDVLPKNISRNEFEKRYIDLVDKTYSAQSSKDTVALPNIIEWFFETVSPNLATISHNIENIDVLETRIKFYEERLLPYREYFVPMVKSLAKSQEELNYTQAIRLYGVGNAKIMLVAFTLAETIKSEMLKWNSKTNLPTLDPKMFIPYAYKTMNTFGEDSRYADVAFNSGLVFDFLHQMNEISKTKSPAIKKFIEVRHDLALGKAKASYKKAASVKDLTFEKQIISYYMLKEAGKIALAFQQADYIDFNNALEKAAIKPLMASVAEKHRFSITHALVGSLFAQIMPGTADAASSILFSEHAFLFDDNKEDHNSLTLTQFTASV